MRLQPMKGRTTLMAMHRLSGLEETDEVLVLQKGKVAERGPAYELQRQTLGENGASIVSFSTQSA